MTPPSTARQTTIVRNRIENAIIKESINDPDGAWRELQKAAEQQPDSELVRTEVAAFLTRHPQFRSTPA